MLVLPTWLVALQRRKQLVGDCTGSFVEERCVIQCPHRCARSTCELRVLHPCVFSSGALSCALTTPAKASVTYVRA